ncbi:guanine nucleotide-binding protein G(o) subunit alpha 1 [Chytriomyces sp. MP71]|nr:guanine nucleotide-binding protein G(o) subunit alpha 1 [Chytriomyces sp. MP71]
MCGTSQSADDLERSLQSKVIDKKLLEEQRVRQVAAKRTFKVLLLGAAESGKSTILKQMRLCHNSPFTEFEYTTYRCVIHSNIIMCAKALIFAMEFLKIPVDSQIFMGSQQADGLSPELANAIRTFWGDAGVRYCYSRANEFQLMDCCLVFLNDITRISDPNYKPTDQDILNSRTITTAVVEVPIHIDSHTILSLYDVGGQRSERKKWASHFDDVRAIIFLMAVSEYDQVLFEDHRTNRMVESLLLFASVCNHVMFRKRALIVFLNKIDLFRAKIPHSPISIHFSDFSGMPESFDEGIQFFEGMIKQSSQDKSREIFVHHTFATDTKQIKNVIANVEKVILGAELDKIGM